MRHSATRLNDGSDRCRLLKTERAARFAEPRTCPQNNRHSVATLGRSEATQFVVSRLSCRFVHTPIWWRLESRTAMAR
jgi:hypothetical protein